MKDYAILFATSEGIQHQSGGIARYNRNFICYLSKIRDVLLKHDISLTLYAAEPALLKIIPSYNQDGYDKVKEILEGTGGKFYRLVNDTYGEDWIKDVRNWTVLSAAASNVAFEVAEKHDQLLVIFGSTCFALMQVYINKQIRAFNANINTLYITHDSAFSSFREEKDENILAMDYLASVWTKFSRKAKIGYVSEYMKELFKKEYAITNDSFIAARSGICLRDKRFKKIGQTEIISTLEKYSIPTDKKLIFSWGRPAHYKRLDLIFSACTKLSYDFFPVAITNGDFPSLVTYIQGNNLRGTVVQRNKDFGLINALLQWKNSVCACFLSESEPGAVTIMEAMYCASDNGPVILANQTGVFKEVINDGKYGFVTDNNPSSIAKMITAIDRTSEEELISIRRAAKKNIIENYDIEKSYRNVMVSEFVELKQFQDELLTNKDLDL